MTGLLLQILAQIDQGVVVVDTDLDVVYANEFVSGCTSVPSDDIIGLSVANVIPLFAEPLYRSMLQRVVDTGQRLELSSSLHGTFLVSQGGTDCPQNMSIECTTEGDKAFVVIQIHDASKQVEQARVLDEEAENRRILLDNISTQVWYLTDECTYGAVNKAHAEFHGVCAECMAFKDLYAILPKDVADLLRATNTHVFDGEQVYTEQWVPSSSGEKRLLAITKNPVFSPDNSVYYAVCSAEDITERRLAEDLVKSSEERFRALFEISPVSIVIYDKDTGEIVDANDRACASYGCASLDELQSTYAQADGLAWIRKAATEGPQVFEWRNRRKTGEVFWEHVQLAPVALDDTVRVLSAAIDITEQKRAEKEIEYLSFHDGLTGLYNRRFYDEELKRLDVPRNLPLTLMLLDVNGLKLTNDAFGHQAGDKLLTRVAAVLQDVCRADDIIARIGGDEFVILLPGLHEEQAREMTKRIQRAVALETVEGLPISVSCGWAAKMEEQEPITDVFKTAEDHMYRQKISERSSYRHQSIDLIMQTLYAKSPRELQHSKRVSQLCSDLAAAMGLEAQELTTAGVLHDIGKVAISESILDKVPPLTTAEWAEVRRHPEAGYSILSSVNDYGPLADCVLAHHERWDGEGYPNGLKGDSIPLLARVIAVADAYDAMVSERSYCRGISHAEAMAEIELCAGLQFDPDVVRVFSRLMGTKRVPPASPSKGHVKKG